MTLETYLNSIKENTDFIFNLLDPYGSSTFGTILINDGATLSMIKTVPEKILKRKIDIIDIDRNTIYIKLCDFNSNELWGINKITGEFGWIGPKRNNPLVFDTKQQKFIEKKDDENE